MLKKIDTPQLKKIKIQLDHKTIIVVRKISSLEVWKQRYPLAKIIE